MSYNNTAAWDRITSDARYLSNAYAVSSSVSSSFATTAGAINFVPSSAVSSSYSLNSDTASSLNPNNAYSVSTITASGLIVSHTPLNTNGLITYADNVLAAALTCGGSNSNFLYDNAGGFSIQASPRSGVLAGVGNSSNTKLQITSGGNVSIGGSNAVNKLDVLGNISASVVTASLHGNADTATSSSYVLTASYSVTSSFALSSPATTLVTASTYQITSSWSVNALTASSINFTPLNSTSASYSKNADTASVANSISFIPTTAVSASFASHSISASNSYWANSSRVDDINNGLVVYLPFSEGTGSVVNNLSPYPVNAKKYELVGGVQTVTGSGWTTNSKRGGYSQLLNGITNSSASWIGMDNGTIASGLNSLTLAIWFQSSGSTTNFGRISKHNAGNDGEFLFAINPTSITFFTITNAGANRVDLAVNTPNLVDGNWHHLVGVYNKSASLQSVYVDGKALGSAAQSGSLNTTNYTLKIGTFDGGLTLNPLIGYVDEFKLWNRALSANEIAYMYNDGNLENSIYTDATGKNTISGSTIFASGITGSLQGTASFSTTAGAINFVPTTASFASTASFAQTASYITASKVVGTVTSSSYAQSASFSSTSSYAVSSSIALGLPDVYDVAGYVGIGIPSPKTTLDVNGNIGNSNGSLAAQIDCGNALLRDNAFAPTLNWNSRILSGSWTGSISNATTASFSQTASFVAASNIVGTVTSSSFASTASFVKNSQTASLATVASSINFIPATATSASFATTANTALNLNNTFVQTNGSGLSFSDSSGAIMSIRGGGITLIWTGSIQPFVLNNSSNAGLMSIDGQGNITTVGYISGSFTGSLLGTASYSTNSSTSSYIQTSGLPYRAGQQSIGNLVTSQIIVFSSVLPTSSYAISLDADTTLASAVSFAATGKTTGGFTCSLSAGISGGTTVDYIAWLNN